MANIKSQIKRIGTNRKAGERNRAVRTELKTVIKNTRTAVNEGNKEAAVAALQHASRKLDKAVSKGAIHKNKAANHKSALAQMVNGLN